jgi:hypothetical protein
VPSVRVEVNGTAATAQQLQDLALRHYGHFTAMQVRDARTRGRELHLGRLDAATRELFGAGLDAARVRAHIRHALGGTCRGVAPVGWIGQVQLPGSAALAKAVGGIYDSVPWDVI